MHPYKYYDLQCVIMQTLKRLGFVMHPLSNPKDQGTSPGKKPLLPSWESLTESWPGIEEHVSHGGNVGLVCGKASNITVLDMDSFLFASDIFGSGINTLKSYRTKGRGHIYFRYNPNIQTSRHHYLGIEVLNDRCNVVAPPSIHASGTPYRWKEPGAPILSMSPDIEAKLETLFKTETELKRIMAKCRTCFRQLLQKNHEGELLSMHGAVGREYMLAVCTDMKAKGAEDRHIQMFAKLIYKEGYDEARTMQEWHNINPSLTWSCEKLGEKVPEYLDDEQCAQCEARKALYNKRDISMFDVRASDKCTTCPYHPSNAVKPVTLENIGEQNMYTEQRIAQPALSMAQVRKDFTFRMSNFVASHGQFTIVEDMPITKPVRTTKKQSQKGNTYDVYMIKVDVDGFVGDLEMFKGELQQLAIVMPADLVNYKGVTLVHDGTRWTAYPPQTATIPNTTSVPAPVSTTVTIPAAVPKAPAYEDQASKYATQLHTMMRMNDPGNAGYNLGALISFCSDITNGDALGLIQYAKSQGLIVEKSGIYRAV